MQTVAFQLVLSVVLFALPCVVIFFVSKNIYMRIKSIRGTVTKDAHDEKMIGLVSLLPLFLYLIYCMLNWIFFGILLFIGEINVFLRSAALASLDVLLFVSGWSAILAGIVIALCAVFATVSVFSAQLRKYSGIPKTVIIHLLPLFTLSFLVWFNLGYFLSPGISL